MWPIVLFALSHLIISRHAAIQLKSGTKNQAYIARAADENRDEI
jgi:hypothetical protein